MSLGTLVTVVALGIALIVTIVHLTGGSRRREKPDTGEAIVEFGKAFPGLAIRDIVMTEDGQATFYRLADGRTGLLQAMGRHSVARLIEPGGVSVTPVEGKAGLSIVFRDTTFKGGTYLFRSSEDAAEVSLWLVGGFALAARSEALSDGASLRAGQAATPKEGPDA